MSRICAICKRPPREGEEMRPMRLKDGDIVKMPDDTEVTAGNGIESGLYSACLECVDDHRKRVAAREGKEVAEVTNRGLC